MPAPAQKPSTWFADKRAVDDAVRARLIKPAAAYLWTLVTQERNPLSVEQLGERMGGLSPSQIRRLRRTLEQAELIEVERQVLRRNRYTAPAALHLVTRKFARPDAQERAPTPPSLPPSKREDSASRESVLMDVEQANKDVNEHLLRLGKPVFLPTPERKKRMGELLSDVGKDGLARALAIWAATPWLVERGDVGMLFDHDARHKVLGGGYAKFERKAKEEAEIHEPAPLRPVSAERMAEYRGYMEEWKGGLWDRHAGPHPGCLGCRIPDELLLEFGIEPFGA
jgi:DNA-binding transcriptional ArsR family regulator